MKEFLRSKGFKMTPQRELIFRSFFELGKHVSIDELFAKVRQRDNSVGYSTVWRNMKLICQVGLAEEVNVGDGVTRYDRVTKIPHGHLYCHGCQRFIEFTIDDIVSRLDATARDHRFVVEGYRVEVHGYCRSCRNKRFSQGKDTGTARPS